MALILFSRLLGFIRERAIADVFGMNWQTDAFRLAFGIPDLMYYLLVAGGLNAAFIPVFTEYLARDEEKQAWRLASTFLTVIVCLLLLMVALGIAFTPSLTPLVAYGYQGEQRSLLIDLIRFMFPAVFFTAMAGVGMGIHRSYKHFSVPMWGPIFYNLAIILSTYFLGRTMGIYGMAYGTVAGAVGNFLIQVPFAWRKSRGHTFAIDLAHPGLKRVFRLMGPAVVSLSIVQINLMIGRNLASGLSEGSPTALKIAETMVQLPLGIFAMGIGMVILPSLSGLMARRELSAFRNTFSQGLRAVFFVTIPSAVGLAVLRVPLIRLLFETGAFTPRDTEMAAYALLFFSLGIWAQSGVQILVQVYYSLQATTTLVRVSLIAVLVNTSLSFILLRATNLEHGALALAFSLTAVVNMLNYMLILRKKIGSIDGVRIVRTVVLSTAAALVMGGVVLWTATEATAWLDTTTTAGQAWQVALAISVGVVTYGAFALLFRMEEIEFIREMVARRGRKKPEAGV